VEKLYANWIFFVAIDGEVNVMFFTKKFVPFQNKLKSQITTTIFCWACTGQFWKWLLSQNTVMILLFTYDGMIFKNNK
jgi:hypothetical protein